MRFIPFIKFEFVKSPLLTLPAKVNFLHYFFGSWTANGATHLSPPPHLRVELFRHFSSVGIKVIVNND